LLKELGADALLDVLPSCPSLSDDHATLETKNRISIPKLLIKNLKKKLISK
jgi:hypothetical protein